jgi:hypothetical protein
MWLQMFLPGYNPQGKTILSVLAKKTYEIMSGKVEVAAEQIPFTESDEFEQPDQFMYSEVIAETDFIPYKIYPDVVVLGKAYTPMQKRAYYLDCAVRVGPLRKGIRVYGNRTVEMKAFKGLVFRDPEPFTEMELGYKNAYGGIAKAKDGTLYSYYPNSIGRGFHLKGGFEDVSELKVPNLEDPDHPVTEESLVISQFEKWPDAPKPASFGFTRRSSYPRYTYAGVMPEMLQGIADQYKQAQGGVSGDITIPKLDFRVYQGASEGLWGADLHGDEQVQIDYMDRNEPHYSFTLPGDIPEMKIDIGEGASPLNPSIHTIVIDMEKKVLSMVWRGAVEIDGFEALATIGEPKISVK